MTSLYQFVLLVTCLLMCIILTNTSHPKRAVSSASPSPPPQQPPSTPSQPPSLTPQPPTPPSTPPKPPPSTPPQPPTPPSTPPKLPPSTPPQPPTPPSTPPQPPTPPSPPPQPPPSPITKCKPYIVGIGGNALLGKLRFGLEPLCLPKMKKMEDPDWCSLSNDVITVRNAHQIGIVTSSHHVLGFPVVSFRCSQGTSDFTNGGFSPSLDAFRHINSAMDMFDTWFQFPVRDVISVQALVHVGHNWDNAAITTSPNSFLDFHEGKVPRLDVNIFLGDGKPTRGEISPTAKNLPSNQMDFTQPYTTTNVIGHELGHALIWVTSSKTAGSFDAQAIVEAFADIVGETLEFYVTGFVDWVTHTGLNIGPSRRRSFLQFTDSTSSKNDLLSSTNDNNNLARQDIYRRGKVFRHVFFLFSQSHGLQRAFRIFLDSVRFHLSKHERWTFEMVACGLVRVSVDDNDETSTVVRHLESVGILVDTILCRKY